MRVQSPERVGVGGRLAAFVLERFPFALAPLREALEACAADRIPERDASRLESFRVIFRQELNRALAPVDLSDVPDPTPGTVASQRLEHARRELVDACDGFLAPEAIAASLTTEEPLQPLP